MPDPKDGPSELGEDALSDVAGGSPDDHTTLLQSRMQRHLDAYTKGYEILSTTTKKVSAVGATITGNVK